MSNQYYPGGSRNGGPGYRGGGPDPQPGAPAQYIYKRPIRHNANLIAGGLILVYLVSFFTMGTLDQLLNVMFSQQVRVELHPLFSQLTELVTYVVTFAVPSILMVAWIDIPSEVAFPLKRPRASIAIPAVFFCLGLMLVGSYLSGMLAVLLEDLLGVTPTSPDFPVPRGVTGGFIYFISVAVAPAILEELTFRGVIMQSLRRFGDSFAIVASGVLFSLCHGNLVQGIPTLLLGIAIGYFVIRTGSLLTGMLIHFVNNGMAVLMEVSEQLLTSEMADAFLMGVFFVYFFGGIVALIFLLLRHPGIFRTIPSRYPLPEGQKHAAFYTSPVMILYLAFTGFVLWLSLG